MKIFDEKFQVGDLIVQDKYAIDKCNPGVDSMFLTTNTYYLLGRRFDHSQFFIGGNPVRFPTKDTRGLLDLTNPNNISRDNLIGLFVYLGNSNETKLCRKLARDMILRGSFFPNTHTTVGDRKFPWSLPDFCGPTSWSVLLRALGTPVLVYPLLFLLDFFALLQVCYSIWLTPVNKTSTVYHTFTSLHFGRKRLPTPWSRLAYHTFVRYRKPVPGFETPDVFTGQGVVSALKYYSRNSFDPKVYRVVEKVLKS